MIALKSKTPLQNYSCNGILFINSNFYKLANFLAYSKAFVFFGFNSNIPRDLENLIFMIVINLNI